VAANVAIPATTKLKSLTGNMAVLGQIRPKDKGKFSGQCRDRYTLQTA
jgi:hypothetical protein